jgi:hypothetical protein
MGSLLCNERGRQPVLASGPFSGQSIGTGAPSRLDGAGTRSRRESPTPAYGQVIEPRNIGQSHLRKGSNLLTASIVSVGGLWV